MRDCDRREREREERRRYENDVFYEVWRSGGDPDRIDFDRIDEHRADGMYPEDAAAAEMRAMRPSRRDQDDESGDWL